MGDSCGASMPTLCHGATMKTHANPLTVVLSLLTAFALTSCDDPPQDRIGVSPVAKESQEEPMATATGKLEPAEWGSIMRLHRLGGVFLASQPKPEDFEQAKKDGVKTVINLRHHEETPGFNEAEVVEELDMEYVNLPWNGPDELTDEVFDKARELLKAAERPILLHCSSANRVGAVWLPYRVLDEGISLDEAVAEAKVVGLKSPDFEAKARDYIERHRAEP